jgi:hypothetical protein
MLQECIIARNHTGKSGRNAGSGAGIYNFSGKLFVSHSRIEQNIIEGRGSGAGIFNDSGECKICYSSIARNHVFYGWITGAGGGVYNTGGFMHLETCAISDNISGLAGELSVNSDGGGVHNSGTMALNRCTISGNATAFGNPGSGKGGDGGGICNRNIMAIESCTISNNHTESGYERGGDGGGIFNGCVLTIANSTIANNFASDGFIAPYSAPGRGGGLFNDVGTMILSHTLVASNSTATDISGKDCFGILTSQNYNLIGDLSACTLIGSRVGDVIGVNPLIGPLANNGGPTPTHALLPGSPAINAGDSRFISPPSTDQRGFPRVVGDVIDIGAFEFY